MDHLLVIAGFGLLIFEPVEGPRGWWKEYWNRFKMNWTQLSWYWGGGILSIFLLCFRNWWLGGDFTPYQSGPAYGLQTTYSFEYESLYVLFSAQSWSSFPSIGISGFILISGMLIALLALVWHSKIFFNFPLSLSISMLGLVLPFFIFKNLGYAPRWSIHLLPLAIFSVSFLLNNIVEKYRVLKLNFYNELS